MIDRPPSGMPRIVSDGNVLSPSHLSFIERPRYAFALLCRITGDQPVQPTLPIQFEGLLSFAIQQPPLTFLEYSFPPKMSTAISPEKKSQAFPRCL